MSNQGGTGIPGCQKESLTIWGWVWESVSCWLGEEAGQGPQARGGRLERAHPWDGGGRMVPTGRDTNLGEKAKISEQERSALLYKAEALQARAGRESPRNQENLKSLH